jgi:6-phosphofructokinase 1
MKRIGVLTSGGDCPGMNPAIRAVVRDGIEAGLEVVGFLRGYVGLIDNNFKVLNSNDVSGIIQRGGTILLTSRCEEFKTDAGIKKGKENLEKNNIDGLVVIGGDGSIHGAAALADMGVKVVALPGSIDNDIYGTDNSLGVDTALNNIVDAVDKIKDTASSHERTFIIEVMGRECGYLAISSAVATGADALIVPEVAFDFEAIATRFRKRYQEGKTSNIILVAEGADNAYHVGRELKKIAGIESKITVLGHLQRGGSPTFFDRLLGARLGAGAVEALLKGESGKMVGIKDRETELTDFEKVLKNKRPVPKRLLELAEKLSR